MDISLKKFKPRDLKYLGVPESVIVQSRAINLKESVLSFTVPSLDNKKARFVSAKQQIAAFTTITKGALRSNYVFAISSTPYDVKAKYLAAYLLGCALDESRKRQINYPRWHLLTGTYKDYYRDTDLDADSRPSLLVLSNINTEASNVKLEKLRDILELYSDIPRIVVLSGPEPVSFLQRKLDFKTHGCLYLTETSRKRVSI